MSFRGRGRGPVSIRISLAMSFVLEVVIRRPTKDFWPMVRSRTPFFLYLMLIVSLAVSLGYLGWVRTWSSVYVPTMYPPFADMRVIQGAVASVGLGDNPRVSNLGDPWRRTFNYPMLWVAIGKTLNFTDESRFIMICTALVLCFAGVCAFLI